MLEGRERVDWKLIKSFPEIVSILKQQQFKIMEGVDVKEVSYCVKWIGCSETLSVGTKKDEHEVKKCALSEFQQ
jgi:hypothetical protein